MLRIEASLRAPGPARLLRPARALPRLRPVKLEAIADQLRRFYWGYQGAQLVRIVPGVVGEVLPDDWDNLLREILEQVEEWDWFSVDWSLLDGDYDAWMQSGEEDYFTQWLEFIPVMRFGFSDYEESWPDEAPPMALLKGLLDGDWGEDVLTNLIEGYNLAADWGSVYQFELQHRLDTADFSGYPEPLCWLPEMARIACNQTGHELLDFSNYFEDDPVGYRWDSDLERVKELWQTAKPTVLRMRKFLAWADGPGEMQTIVDALIGPQPADPSTSSGRKRKRKAKPKKASRLNTLVEILAPGVE